MTAALVNGRVLTDGRLRRAASAVVIDGGRIAAVVADAEIAGRRPTRHDLGRRSAASRASSTPRSTAAAACCSTTIRRVETIAAIGAAHRAFGTTGFLPTLISDDLHVVERGDRAVDAAIDAGRARRARHPHRGAVPQRAAQGHARRRASSARSTRTAIGLLTSLKRGRTLVTLAPETHDAGDDPRAGRRRRHRLRRPHQRHL